MNIRRATVLILSVPVVVAITLWFFSARIVSSLLPPLVERDSIRITRLEVGSIGFDQARVSRLSGRALTPAGATTFDIRDATISYELPRLEPGRLRIGSAKIEHEPEPSPAAETMTDLAVPSPVTIDRLHLSYGDAFEFNGSFAFTGSQRAFTIHAIDEDVHFTVAGDASLSAFDVSLAGEDQKRIGAGRLEFTEPERVSFSADLELGPALDWLRTADYLPLHLAAVADRIDSVSGTLGLAGHAAGRERWSVDLDLGLQRLAAEQFNVTGDAAGRLEHADGNWSFTSSQPGEIQLTTVDELLVDVYSLNASVARDYRVNLTGSTGGGSRLQGDGDGDIAFFQSGKMDLTARLGPWSVVDWEQVRIGLQAVEITDPASMSIGMLDATATLAASPSGEVTLAAVKVDPWPQGVEPADLRFDWEWTEEGLLGNGSARLGGPPEVSWKLSSRGGRGRLTASLESTMSDLARPFEKAIKSGGYDLEFFGGDASARLNWTWDNARYDNYLEFAATDVIGRFMGLEFENARLNLKSSDLVAPTFQFSGEAPAVTLANDVGVTDLSLAGRWQSGLHLDQARFSTLGGQVKVNPFFLDPAQPEVAAELEISEIDLGQVMEMVGQEDLVGSGRLSGSIPLKLRDGELAIDNGRLKNTTLGHISYQAGEAAASQLNNIAVQALQDFRYDLIDATLNYQFDGAYSIRARIEGKNPTLYGGYPVAFNLNLSGALPGLMRASLITGDFHDEIMKQIKQRD